MLSGKIASRSSSLSELNRSIQAAIPASAVTSYPFSAAPANRAFAIPKLAGLLISAMNSAVAPVAVARSAAAVADPCASSP